MKNFNSFVAALFIIMLIIIGCTINPLITLMVILAIGLIIIAWGIS